MKREIVMKPRSLSKTLIMIMGVQRSGTTALFDILAEAPGVSPRQESAGDDIYDDFFLRPEPDIREILNALPGTVLLKPVRESERRSPLEVAEEYRDYDLRIIWLYRDPVNVFHSYVRRGWSDDSLAYASGFASEWNCRNSEAVTAAAHLGDRLLVINYEDLTTHRSLVCNLAESLGVRTTGVLRVDSARGRRTLPEEIQRLLDERTENVREALDGLRTVRPRGEDVAQDNSLIRRLQRWLVTSPPGKPGRTKPAMTISTAVYDEVARVADVGAVYQRWRQSGPIQRDATSSLIAAVGYQACRVIHGASLPTARRSSCPWRETGETASRAQSLETDFASRRSALRSRVASVVQTECGAWPRNEAFTLGDRLSSLADRLVFTMLDLDWAEDERFSRGLNRLAGRDPAAGVSTEWEPICKAVEQTGLIHHLLRKGLLLPGETQGFIEEACLPLQALGVVVEKTLLAMCARPDILEQVRSDPGSMRPAIEEALRLTPLFLGMRRRMTRPLTSHGFELSAGEEVDLRVGAANRDPDVFPDPDAFRLDRRVPSPFLFEEEYAPFTRLVDERRPGCDHFVFDAAALLIGHLIGSCRSLRIDTERRVDMVCHMRTDGTRIQWPANVRLVCSA